MPHLSNDLEGLILAKYNSAGTSYVEVDDSGGTPRDLTPYADFIDFCGRDFFDPTVSVKEIVIQGPWDDKASTGSDVVLGGILGTVVTVSFGPAGNASGARKITGEWTFSDYSIDARAAGRLTQAQVDGGEAMVRYTAVFQISSGFSLTTWP